MAIGRPRINWTDTLEDAICAAIAVSAKGLDDICSENEEFPDPKSIYTHIIQSGSFFQKYARAREMQQQLLADQLVPLADKDRICQKRTIKADGSEETVILDQVERSKLQIETRKWVLARLNPKKYGDKLNMAGADGDGPLEVIVKHIGGGNG